MNKGEVKHLYMMISQDAIRDAMLMSMRMQIEKNDRNSTALSQYQSQIETAALVSRLFSFNVLLLLFFVLFIHALLLSFLFQSFKVARPCYLTSQFICKMHLGR